MRLRSRIFTFAGLSLLAASCLAGVPSRSHAGGIPGGPADGLAPGSEGGGECTIAVLTGEATRDGRPILWKNRDAGDRDNEVRYFDGPGYRSVALVTAGTTGLAWIGVNERGFAILNALAYNLTDSIPGGTTNGILMKRALDACSTVEDFARLLEQTDGTGRENPANFACIDASGGAMVFEAGSRSFIGFDANDPAVAPEGFLCRANFALSADTTRVDTFRYRRCRELVHQAVAAGGADDAWLLRTVACDLRMAGADPYPLPFEGAPPGRPSAVGYVDCTETINRNWSVAGGLVHGVRPGEDPLLSTFFGVVSQPVVTIPLPVWVAAGPTPSLLDGPKTSPLCDLALQRVRAAYDFGNNTHLLNTNRLVTPAHDGYLERVETVENWLLPETEAWVAAWRESGVSSAVVAAVEAKLAEEAFRQYQTGQAPDRSTARFTLQVSPNPTGGEAAVLYHLPEGALPDWAVNLYDSRGRRVGRLGGGTAGGPHQGAFAWNGRDDSGRLVAPGVYYYRATWPPGANGGKLVIVR